MTAAAGPLLAIRVECGADEWGEGAPRRFFLGTRKIEVIEILDRWPAPDYGYFKVRGDDGALYIIRHDIPDGQWELTLFALNR